MCKNATLREEKDIQSTRRDRKGNTWVKSVTKVVYIVKRVRRMEWQWVGHVVRKMDERWTK